MPTIYDVARKAGVSPKTVSRVLNQEPNVRQTTLEAVERAIEYLDYRPSTAARLLKSQRTRVVGFLTDRVVTSPEANAIARGVSEAARKRREGGCGGLAFVDFRKGQMGHAGICQAQGGLTDDLPQ